VTAPAFPTYAPTVPNMLDALRSSFGAADCVVTPRARLTFAELDAHSRRFAARLVELGVVKGTHVGVLYPNGVDWVVAWCAAARLGAVTVPVNTFYREAELGRFLRHADVQVLVGVPGLLRRDFAASIESVAPDLARDAQGRLRSAALPQLRSVAFSGQPVPAWAEQLAAIEIDARSLDRVAAMGGGVRPADTALITYTSGSTGEPKGVVHSHGAVVRHAYNLAALSAAGPATRVWSPMPLFWVGGLVYAFLRSVIAGGCFLTQDVFEPSSALALLERERATDIAAWPAATRAMLEHPDFASTDLGALRSGWPEALPPDRRPNDPTLTVHTLGMSETCGPHTFKTEAETAHGVGPEDRGAFGHPVPGLQHRIVDPDTLCDLPSGEQGELLVRGYSLMTGLYGRERSDVFDTDGWYHTGDLGYLRDGWLFFTGRRSDLIKTNGSNVSPAEVEACLCELESLRAAFVVGVPDAIVGQRVVALVVPSERTAVDVEHIRVALRSRLASYKVPAAILPIDGTAVPLLASQKVDRARLTDLACQLLTRPHSG
jgi:acyl-CoA synthetase (AMP-forming)/AMP-acid ligase II